MFKTKKQLRKELEEIKEEATKRQPLFWEEVKKNSDLKRQISSLKESNEFLREENERLKKQLSGEHVCTGYCQGCEHGIISENWNFITGKTAKTVCALECKCKDFVEKMP